MNSTPKRSVCITGCSSGFGKITALHLARQGWRVFATVRKAGDQKELLQQCGDRIVPVICDITNTDDVAKLRDGVQGGVTRLDALINNAGTAFPSPLELLPSAELLAQLKINVVAHVAVTQALLPMLKAARGKIVNVSSVYGKIAQPVFGAYCASKFALEALNDAWRIELAPSGVQVVAIEPYVSRTSIQETGRQRSLAFVNPDSRHDYDSLIEMAERLYSKQLARGFPPTLFAATIERILEDRRPRARYVIPKRAMGLIWLRRLIPDPLWDRAVRRALRW